VVSTPLKNVSKSVGIIIPNIWKNENVTNHQSEKIYHGLFSSLLLRVDFAICDPILPSFLIKYTVDST
jgi:hypothetical protein